MMWCSMVFIVHLDGIPSVTKRNIIIETVGNVILLLLKGVVNPQRLTSEPIEHFFGHLRMCKSEFTALDFVHLVLKILVRYRSMFEGNLKVLKRMNKGSGLGYRSTFNNDYNRRSENQKFKSYEGGIFTGSSFPSFNLVWNELFNIISPMNKCMKSFLSNIFEVEEFHRLLNLNICHKKAYRCFKEVFENGCNNNEVNDTTDNNFNDANHLHNLIAIDCSTSNNTSSNNTEKLLKTSSNRANTNDVDTTHQVSKYFHKILCCKEWESLGELIKSLMSMMSMYGDNLTTSREQKKKNIHGRYIGTNEKVVDNDIQDQDSIKRGSIVRYKKFPDQFFRVTSFSKKNIINFSLQTPLHY